MLAYSQRDATKHTLSEEPSIPLDQFTAHSRSSKLDECIPLIALTGTDSDLLDFVDSHSRSSPQALDDSL